MQVQSPVQIARQLLEGPLTRPALVYWRRHQFLSKSGLGSCFGLFASFDAARAWLPRSEEFDHAALAEEYVNVRSKKVFAYDYPVMWWLERAFRGGAKSVLDVGGSVGVHYYAYGRYFQMPETVSWCVVEVPAMVAIGQALAKTNGAGALSFVTDLQGAHAECDILIAAGSLQYFADGRPAQLLERLAAKPRHILLNKLPLYDGEDYVTTQNIGEGCYSPLHVYNQTRFIREVEGSGYELLDRWPVHERSLYLPGYPDRSFFSFSGLYFAQKAPRSQDPVRS
jgi:putative methyltransferase (TIGR04325 family)